MNNIFTEILKQNNIDIYHRFTHEELMNENFKKTVTFDTTVDGVLYKFKVVHSAIDGIHISFLPETTHATLHSNDIYIKQSLSGEYSIRIDTSESGFSGDGIEFYQNKLKALILNGQAIDYVIHLHDDNELEKSIRENFDRFVNANDELQQKHKERVAAAFAEFENTMEFTFKRLNDAIKDIQKLQDSFNPVEHSDGVKKVYTVLTKKPDGSIEYQDREITFYRNRFHCDVIENGNRHPMSNKGTSVKKNAAVWISKAVQPKSRK